MNYVLLTGAGFSRNWGGWLASEAFEYLLGCPQVTADIRNHLWAHKRKGGFEDALAELQKEFVVRPDKSTTERLNRLQDAILQMFRDMDAAFARVMFEPQNDLALLVRSFLVRFDAIFTLNQDTLMERHYLNGNVELSPYRKWNGWELPGMTPEIGGNIDPGKRTWRPQEPAQFKVSKTLQPFFKLHGSSTWQNNTGAPVLVMGGAKAAELMQHPVLLWYFGRFEEYLSRPDTRLMVIGYSFGDHHINQAITHAADRGTLRVFVIDPLGVDVLDKNRHAVVYTPGELIKKLEPHVIGACRRPLSAVFGGDIVEHDKLMRFFA